MNGTSKENYTYDINEIVRRKIIGTILDNNYKYNNSFFGTRYDELDEYILYLDRTFGIPISDSSYSSNQRVQEFLSNTSLEFFLSSLECLIQLKISNLHRQFNGGLDYDRKLIENLIININNIFKVEKIGYEIVPAGLDDLMFIIVPYNSKYLYVETIKRPRELIYNITFDSALKDFDLSLEKYRIEDYENAIKHSTKALEAVMLKIIVDLKIEIKEKSEIKIHHMVRALKESEFIDSKFSGIFDSFWGVIDKGSSIKNDFGHGDVYLKTAYKHYAEFVMRNTGTYIVFLIEQYEIYKNKVGNTHGKR